MARWKRLELSASDGHPAPGQLCVLRALYTGCTGVEREEYRVGRFVHDEKDPGSRKLWWLRGDVQATLENPAAWRTRYHDILFAEITPVEGGDRNA